MTKSKRINNPLLNRNIGFTSRFEWIVLGGIVLVAVALIYKTFIPEKTEYGEQSQFSQLVNRADALGRETDPIRRDAMCIPLSSFSRSIDAQIPTNARIFLFDMLGPDNASNVGYYYFLKNYLYPRELAISFGKPATYGIGGMRGINPTSLEQLEKAGYDLVLKQTPKNGWQSQVLKPLANRGVEGKTKSIPKADTYIAFLLPLAVALTGSRLVRWLFKDLNGVLTTGEWLASGLAVGMFLLTQLILFLRMADVRLEQFLGIAIAIWALLEITLIIRDVTASPPKWNVRYLWWLLLLPVGMVFWCLFRLAGLEGMLEFDAVAHWEWKAKLIYYTAGNDMWTWASNPENGYAHLDYPLTVTLIYTFTWGVLGHINEFVIKFWNQWMLLLLVLAILGGGGFTKKNSWLIASVVSIIPLTPLILQFTQSEGGTIFITFYCVLASIQLAIGLIEKSGGRLRLGLFLLMGAAMVKIEGAIFLGLWGILLILDKEGRNALWPIKKFGVVVIIGLMAWVPYFIYRSHIFIIHPDNMGLRLIFHNWIDAIKLLPMIWVALVTGRLFNSGFASWSAPDNLHSVWDGKWLGLNSFIDSATLGIGWVCIAAFIFSWMRGGRLRFVAWCFFAVFLGYSLALCIAFLSFAPQEGIQPFNYSTALRVGSGLENGGRYLISMQLAWLTVIAVLLSRETKKSANNLEP